jgi:antitoxin ParD1/3/4
VSGHEFTHAVQRKEKNNSLLPRAPGEKNANNLYCHKLTTIVNRDYTSPMNVNLGPIFDDFVADLLKTGLYQSQSEILREALRLLKEREELKGLLRLAGLRKEIALGAREADRGKFVDGARAFADIRRKGRQRKTSGR